MPKKPYLKILRLVGHRDAMPILDENDLEDDIDRPKPRPMLARELRALLNSCQNLAGLEINVEMSYDEVSCC